MSAERNPDELFDAYVEAITASRRALRDDPATGVAAQEAQRRAARDLNDALFDGSGSFSATVATNLLLNAAQALSRLSEIAGPFEGRTDIAERWGVTPGRVRQMSSSGDFPEPVDKINGQPYWRPADVDAWRERQPGSGRRPRAGH